MDFLSNPIYSFMRKLKWKLQTFQNKQNMHYCVSKPINIVKAVRRGKSIISKLFITKQEQKKMNQETEHCKYKESKNLLKVKAEIVKLSTCLKKLRKPTNLDSCD